MTDLADIGDTIKVALPGAVTGASVAFDQLTLSIDAYPERDFRGHVASVQPGSGTAFSLLPARAITSRLSPWPTAANRS